MTPEDRAPKSHHLVVEGLRIHYLEAGQGPPLVLLHGTAIDSARLSFGPSLEALALHHRVIALDWPGYGQSEYPPESLGIGDYVRLFGHFALALELPPFHLLGFSMGGAVALGAALALPERVRSLVLVGSYGLGRRLRVPFVPYLALRTPRLGANVLLGLRLSRRLTGLVLRRLIFANPGAVSPELVNAVYQQLKRPLAERAFMAWLRGELRPLHYGTSYRRQLEHIRQPTLLLHGARDLVVSARDARAAAKALPNATLELIPRCGHWLMREQPRVFETSVLEFLKRCEARVSEDAAEERTQNSPS